MKSTIRVYHFRMDLSGPFSEDGMTLTEITSPVEGHGREALESHKASPELDHSASMPSIATKPMAATPCMAPLSAMMPG